MKPLARPPPLPLPAPLAALERALGPGGVSALDPRVPAAIWRRALAGPAAEFLARPGKELRASIVRAGWRFGGGADGAMPESLPLVIELLHAGSLIIDDVEDDSDERRGAPTLHRLVGPSLAINTGSWMYFWALAELGQLRQPAATALAAQRAALDTLIRCHQGQALDLAVRICDLALEDVMPLVAATTRLKTGALCTFAAALGALGAGAPPAIQDAVARFGDAMGTGLQMLDDLGSLTSPARRAKGLEDLRGRRPTWPWAWLAEQGAFAWSRLAAEERAVAAGTGDAGALADALADATRSLGRARIGAQLDAALAALVDACAAGWLGADAQPVIDAIAGELRRMEESYG